MATFSYKATDASGKTLKGMIEADSERLAISALSAKGLVPFSVNAASGSAGKKSAGAGKQNTTNADASWLERARAFLASFQRVPPAAVAAVARQLATLFRAGLPIDEALASLCMHDDGSKMREVLAQIRDSILTGKTFADSMAAFPRVFSSTFITMVRAGEEAGTLELVIERYATHIEQQVALLRKVQATLAYPILMLVVGAGIVVFLLAYVIPEVTSIFSDMGRALPMPTQILLNISGVLRSYWWIILSVFGIALTFFLRYIKTPKGKTWWHTFLLRCPGFRSVYRPLLVGHMVRTLGMLLNNGVSLLKALHIVQSIAENKLMHGAVQNMIDGVQAGRDMSAFMDNPVLFPPLVRQMISAGERSGQLGEMLLWVAEDCETRVATQLQILTALLEPIMILLLGCLVGFVVIAIMLPIFQMSTLAA